MQAYHIPVLLKESIEALNIKPDGIYVDCTLGEAGHSIEILKKISKKGKLYSIDQDTEAIKFVSETYPRELSTGNWELVHTNFKNISKIGDIKVDGMLMDLGVSSRQLDQKERGFTYQQADAQLDMRMDTGLGVTASDLLKALNDKELEKLFRLYGEERFAGKIARAIKKRDIRTVGDLTSLIYKVVPATTRREDSHHPARRVFQALRIAVNDELNSLREGLDNAFKILNSRGRLVVITFHSLEDRITKEFFKSVSDNSVIIGDITIPTEEEIERNPRSRTSKLRVLEKL